MRGVAAPFSEQGRQRGPGLSSNYSWTGAPATACRLSGTQSHADLSTQREQLVEV